MSKSQNTKNEQQKDLCITSEQLTEQLKKGKLPEGFYYVNDGTEVKIDYYLCGYWEWHFNSDIKQVLAPVPSYEEWQAKLEENAQLKERVSKLEKMQYSYTPEEWNTMLRTVNRTKELLARAKGIITAYRLTGNQSTYSDNDMKECVDKIDEVLK